MKFFSTLKDKLIACEDKFNFVLKHIGLELKDEWHLFYKKYSVWGFTAFGAAPDLYNAAQSTGFLTSATAPAALDQLMKGIAFLGIASHLMKTKKKEVETAKPVEAETEAEAPAETK